MYQYKKTIACINWLNRTQDHCQVTTHKVLKRANDGMINPVQAQKMQNKNSKTPTSCKNTRHQIILIITSYYIVGLKIELCQEDSMPDNHKQLLTNIDPQLQMLLLENHHCGMAMLHWKTKEWLCSQAFLNQENMGTGVITAPPFHLPE